MATTSTSKPKAQETASNEQKQAKKVSTPKTQKATKQAKVSPRSGTAPPKSRQFGQPNGNPRHNGAWKKEDTPRFKLEQMMKMSKKELEAVIKDDEAPCFEQKLAKHMLNGEWKEIEAMINQVYGAPKAPSELVVSGSVSTEINRPYKGLTIDQIRKVLKK